jgi:hypothetical protein
MRKKGGFVKKMEEVIGKSSVMAQKLSMVDMAVLLALIAIVVAAFTVLPVLVSAAQ